MRENKIHPYAAAGLILLSAVICYEFVHTVREISNNDNSNARAVELRGEQDELRNEISTVVAGVQTQYPMLFPTERVSSISILE